MEAPAMRSDLERHAVGFTGLIALVAGLAISVAAVVHYGSAMFQNLLAGFAGTLITIGITILGLDRVVRLERRRRWNAGYTALAGLLAQTFVDAMRLLYVRSSSSAYKIDRDRYAEFARIGDMHLAALTGVGGSLATILDPELYLGSQHVEQRLRWMLGHISQRPSMPTDERAQFRIMQDTAKILRAFLSDTRNVDYIHAKTINSLIDRVGADRLPSLLELVDTDPVYLERYRVQQWLWDQGMLGAQGRKTIADDIENKVAISYFLIDDMILSVPNPVN
jgi:hypothetical protein